MEKVRTYDPVILAVSKLIAYQYSINDKLDQPPVIKEEWLPSMGILSVEDIKKECTFWKDNFEELKRKVKEGYKIPSVGLTASYSMLIEEDFIPPTYLWNHLTVDDRNLQIALTNLQATMMLLWCIKYNSGEKLNWYKEG